MQFIKPAHAKSHEIAAMCCYSDPRREDNVALVLAEECCQLALLQQVTHTRKYTHASVCVFISACASDSIFKLKAAPFLDVKAECRILSPVQAAVHAITSAT